jgi:carbon storage regulator
MLVISRRKGQRIVIGDDIELVVTSVTRNTVKLGIKASRGLAVLRGEVRDAILEANRVAAESSLEHAVALAESGPPAATDAVTPLAKLGLARQPSDGTASQTSDATRDLPSEPGTVTGSSLAPREHDGRGVS